MVKLVTVNRCLCFWLDETPKLIYFSKEIHAQITSLGFQDCKIFIHSVDAQSSADGGIIIQVIGEMSNNSGPWRKFVQTFFLAEQPNGYFVLNDIFRFLKEDSVEGDLADEPEPVTVPDEPTPAAAPEPAPAPVEFTREPSPPPPPAEVVDATAAPVEEPPATVVDIVEPVREPTPEPVAQVNGHEIEEPATPVPVSKSPTPAPSVASPTPPPPAAAPSPSPAPPVQAPAAAPVSAAPTPAPASVTPAAAPVPKTWANLAATNTKKWGNAVAHESRGSSENVPSAPAVASTSSAQTPVRPPGTPSRTPHPAYAAAQSVNTAQCFIKVGFSEEFILVI